MARKLISVKKSRRKSGKVTARFGLKKMNVEIVVATVGDEVENQGFKIFPSTEQAVVHVIARGVSSGVIQNEQDATLSAAALLAAGVQEADEQGTVLVRAGHVRRGWRERLASTGGNCPPHKCMRSSILMKAEVLRAELPGFKDIADSALDKLDI